MRFKILAALAILAGAAFFPLLALGDPKPALNEFEIEVQAFAPDAYGRLAGQISIRRANALPFETSYDTSFFATEFPPDQNGFMRVNARLGDGNLYAATIIQSEPGELPGMPMMHAHANLLGAGPPPPSPPAAITDLAATSNEDSQSTLTWSAVAGADSYDVYMSQLALPFSLANGGAGEDASSPFIVLYLSNGLEASFKVIARGPGGSSESNVATGTPADVVAPSAPAAPALTAADTEIEVTLPALYDDVVGFRVYYSTTEVGGYVEATGSLATGSHTITGLTNSTLYYVRIAAEDEAENLSAQSDASSATPESAELDIPAMTDLVALFRPLDDEVNESETSAGQVFWLDASATGGNDALVVSSSANPTYTSGVSVNFESTDTLNFASALDSGALFDIFLTCKFTGAGSFYVLYSGSTKYMRLTQSTGTIQCRVNGAGSQGLWSNSGDGISLPIGEWVLVRLRRDSTSAMSLWVNGTLISQKTFSPTAETLEGTSLINTGSSVSIGHVAIFNANVAETPAGELTDALKAAYGIE